MKLGSGIPLELPLIIDKRPPTKKDFINIPLLKTEDKQSSLKLIIDKKSVR